MIQIDIDIPANVMVAAALKGGAEHVFFSAIKGATVKEDRDKFPESIFLFSGNHLIMEIRKLKQIWCSYSLLWSKIEPHFDGVYPDIQQFIKSMVEEHFKLKDVTPEHDDWPTGAMVEEHFKLKDVTPGSYYTQEQYAVEEHFKLKDVAPPTSLRKRFAKVEEHFKLKDVTPVGFSQLDAYSATVEGHFKSKE